MGSCAAPSAKGDDKFITTDYLQQCPFPCWSSYIINHFGIMHSAHGGPVANRPFATAILTTYGGTISGRQDALAFAIPNRNDGYNKPVIIPPNFKKLTYGQFYDITHPHLV